MTVKRVVNQSGPQSVNNCQDAVSQHTLQTATERSASHTAEFPLPTGIYERLSSMETHVKLSPGKYSFSMFTKFCECFLLSWLGPLLAALRYVNDGVIFAHNVPCGGMSVPLQ